ncbi:hypothetical protein ACO2Q3_19280 [Caulobacter sp. KR2-114]|uniref:hypothetical protein n=1 Tax=Caulobacter sp. KR2-114 TaxID=3400912 RepID=UPI003C006265
MSSEWTHNGPVSLPPRSVAYGAGVLVLLVGLAGLGFGFKTGLRSSQPGAADASARVAADGSAEEAKPIVVLPPPVTAPVAATAAPKKDDGDSSADDAKEAQAQAAAAQQVQGKGKSGQDIDDILTSSSEKPPAPVKPSNDEAPPTRSDVPY